jgi:hypothetical protein
MTVQRIADAAPSKCSLEPDQPLDFTDSIPIDGLWVEDEFRGKLITDPLPDEIARRAAEIRATWDAAEELKRREQPIAPWLVPLTGNNRSPRPRPRRDAD